MPREIARDEALSITLELWQHLAKTGGGFWDKHDWEGWQRYDLEGCKSDCALFHYSSTTCTNCPYYIHYGITCLNLLDGKKSPYDRYGDATTPRSHQYWARQCVKQIKEIINA